jgi:putative flippase GtrA
LPVGLVAVTLANLIVRYVAFAALAMVANLLAQRLVLAFDQSVASFVAAVFLGTAVGLIVKYMLDKRWIFFDQSTGLLSHSQKFSLYTAMGIVTTAVFWGLETSFWLIWNSDLMREIGAVLGLSLGYVIKYQLDRRYVFTDAQLTERTSP